MSILPDLTVEAYFPDDIQVAFPPQGSDAGSKWYQNATFEGESQAPPNLSDSWSALDFATRAYITTSAKYELPTSTSTADLNINNIAIESLAAFVQYIPNLVRQHLTNYEAYILTDQRRRTLSTMSRTSPKCALFLSKYAELLEEQIFYKNEMDYCDYLHNLLKAGCRLAEMIDDRLVSGEGGWTIHREHAAPDFAVKYKGDVKIVLEGKQAKAGECMMRETQEGNPLAHQNVELSNMSKEARSALRKVNCSNCYPVHPNNS